MGEVFGRASSHPTRTHSDCSLSTCLVSASPSCILFLQSWTDHAQPFASTLGRISGLGSHLGGQARAMSREEATAVGQRGSSDTVPQWRTWAAGQETAPRRPPASQLPLCCNPLTSAAEELRRDASKQVGASGKDRAHNLRAGHASAGDHAIWSCRSAADLPSRPVAADPETVRRLDQEGEARAVKRGAPRIAMQAVSSNARGVWAGQARKRGGNPASHRARARHAQALWVRNRVPTPPIAAETTIAVLNHGVALRHGEARPASSAFAPGGHPALSHMGVPGHGPRLRWRSSSRLLLSCRRMRALSWRRQWSRR